jgi:peptidoglycan/xylan/chitin deacetylase (PgdA/CDA1 family)
MRAISSLIFANLVSFSLSFALKRKDTPIGQVITSCVEPNTIALTFDDGPSEYTKHFLDVLRDYDARATFFVLGEAAQEHPELLRRIQDEQHQIGSHTYVHVRLSTLILRS